jgi:hypothetical protein
MTDEHRERCLREARAFGIKPWEPTPSSIPFQEAVPDWVHEPQREGWLRALQLQLELVAKDPTYFTCPAAFPEGTADPAYRRQRKK